MVQELIVKEIETGFLGEFENYSIIDVLFESFRVGYVIQYNLIIGFNKIIWLIDFTHKSIIYGHAGQVDDVWFIHCSLINNLVLLSGVAWFIQFSLINGLVGLSSDLWFIYCILIFGFVGLEQDAWFIFNSLIYNLVGLCRYVWFKR